MWQELTWDFTDFDTDAARFETLTLIPGIGETPAEQREIYFDRIQIGSANCSDFSSSTRTPIADIEQLQAWPNPVSNVASVLLPEGATQLRILDQLGRTVGIDRFASARAGQFTEVVVDHLPSGLYTVFAQGVDGAALGRVRLSVAH